MAASDRIDCIDCEGVQIGNDCTVSLSIAAMVISSSIIFCSRSPRVDDTYLILIKQSLEFIQKYDIRIPHPIIYIQLPVKTKNNQDYCVEIHQGKSLVSLSPEEFIEHWKSQLSPELLVYIKQFNLKPLILPTVNIEPSEIISDNPIYRHTVMEFIEDVIREEEKNLNRITIEERLAYLESIVKALNDPKNAIRIIADRNIEQFRYNCKLTFEKLQKSKIQNLIETYKPKITKNNKDYSIWCGKNINFGEDYEKLVSFDPFFNKNNPKCLEIVQEYSKIAIIYPQEYLKASYNEELHRFKEEKRRRVEDKRKAEDRNKILEMRKRKDEEDRKKFEHEQTQRQKIEKEKQAEHKKLIDDIEKKQIEATDDMNRIELENQKRLIQEKEQNRIAEFKIKQIQEETAKKEKEAIESQKKLDLDTKQMAAESFYKSLVTTFNEYIKTQLNIASAELSREKVCFEPHDTVHLPESYTRNINSKRETFKKELMSKFPYYKPPFPFLPAELEVSWKPKVDALKAQWASLTAERKGRYKFITSGDHTCPKCFKSHLNGVTHKKCSNINNSPEILWYWIEKDWGICSGCDKVSEIFSTCCYSCSAPLNVTLSHDTPN